MLAEHCKEKVIILWARHTALKPSVPLPASGAIQSVYSHFWLLSCYTCGHFLTPMLAYPTNLKLLTFKTQKVLIFNQRWTPPLAKPYPPRSGQRIKNHLCAHRPPKCCNTQAKSTGGTNEQDVYVTQHFGFQGLSTWSHRRAFVDQRRL